MQRRGIDERSAVTAPVCWHSLERRSVNDRLVASRQIHVDQTPRTTLQANTCYNIVTCSRPWLVCSRRDAPYIRYTYVLCITLLLCLIYNIAVITRGTPEIRNSRLSSQFHYVYEDINFIFLQMRRTTSTCPIISFVRQFNPAWPPAYTHWTRYLTTLPLS